MPTPLVSGMGDDSKLVYVCKSSNDLDFFTYKGSFGGPVDTIQRKFFGQDGISLRRYSFEREPGDDRYHQNIILAPSGDFIDVLVYDIFDEMDCGWRAHRFPRSERHAVVAAFLEGRMTLKHTGTHDKKTGTYRVIAEGPKVIVVDESKTVTKRQPTIDQYRRIIRMHRGVPRVVNEDATQVISFDLGIPDTWPAPSRHDEDDHHYV